MAAFLAPLSAMCFALAATLQQRGRFVLAQAGSAVQGLAGLFRLVMVPIWLLRRQVLGAGVVVVGLAMFVLVGDPDAGVDDIHEGIAEAAADWRTWALLGFGFIAFLIQQLSLATGQLAPAMAAVSVSNPAIRVLSPGMDRARTDAALA